MHEMSIVSGILDIVEQEARKAGADAVTAVQVEVGQLAGVEIPALEFAFEVARRGTLAAAARLVIHEIPGRGVCTACGEEVAVDFFAAVCPACDGGLVDIRQGRELRVRSMDID